MALTAEHFAPHATSKGGFKGRCRDCLRLYNRWNEEKRQRELEAIKVTPQPLKAGERCRECEGMPHRRPAEGCPRCRLPYQPLPPVQPVLRKFDWAV